MIDYECEMMDNLSVLIHHLTFVEQGKSMIYFTQADVSGQTATGLSLPGFELLPTGLVPTAGPTFEEWEAAGKTLRQIEGAVHWWIGDWLNYGERAYGEMYSQALETTALEYQTLANTKYIADKIELSRRRENLPFSYHGEVARLEPAKQDELLDKAESEGWTRQQLRVEVRNLPARQEQPTTFVPLEGSDRYRVDCDDCLEWFAAQAPGSVDLVFGSPPYEQARLYLENGEDPGIARDTDAWVAWMVDVFRAALRVCRGLVAFVVEGQTKDYQWSAAPALLMSELRRSGITLRKPPIYHRVGIPGSGGPDWLRNDYEFIICATNGGQLPWSDNTAMGHEPKYAPGGDPSHRTVDGSRVNDVGYATMEDRNNLGPHRARQRAGRVYQPPERANPGNVIHCSAGGGNMGPSLCHENEAPFPEDLARFFVLSFCPLGGRVCDPFCGSGTTGAVSVAHGRYFLGCDVRSSQVQLSLRRLSQVQLILPTMEG